MYQALLVDGDTVHAQQLTAILMSRSLSVTHVLTVEQGIRSLQNGPTTFEFVIVAIHDRVKPWASILRNLQAAARQHCMSIGPLFLCISRMRHEPEFQLQIELTGVRYVIEK
jgi:ActR/RegA family two-component response regulator